MASKIKTPAELRRSTKTKFVETVNGVDIYSHTITAMAGNFVALYNDTDWETFITKNGARVSALRVTR